MEFIIEKDVPLPKSRTPVEPREIEGRINWPFKTMEPGDSILIADRALHMRARSAFVQYMHRTGKKFTSRARREGLRIWRVS